MLILMEPIPYYQLWAWTAEAKQAIASSLNDSRPSEVVVSKEQAATVAARWLDEG